MGHTLATLPEAEQGRIIVLDDYAHRQASAAPAVRVLIADSHSLVRAGFRALLEAGGKISVVAEAATDEETAELAHRIRPDVALIDAELPECLGTIRRLSEGSNTAVMLLTDSEADERIFAALRCGARGVLLKDSAPAELVDAIEVLARGEAPLSPRLTRRLIAELAARPEPRVPRSELLDELTPREREVVAQVALGLSNDEIAERLVITRATAKTHVSRAMNKLHARQRAQLVVAAYETGLVAPRIAT
jgi:DNA-binding NarL/FixJ family response regulator